MAYVQKTHEIAQYGRRNPATARKVGYPRNCLPETIAGRTVDDIHVTTGILAYEAGRFEEAIKFFGNALLENGKNAVAYMYVGMMQRDFGAPDDAIRMLTRAIALDGNSPQAHVERCKAYIDRNALDDAREDAARAIELDQDYAPAYLWMGVCKAQAGRHVDAIALLAKYFELAPEDSESREKFRAYREAALKLMNPEPAPVGFVCSFTPVKTTDGAVAFIITRQLITTQRDGPELH
ncbi:MAG: tetratricopeptide repeat protein [Candidatus ainarchaeum sp.]|nr:tetratricopeptide repeat protein [Candidatus ainarchaeum sp.]